MGKEQPQHDPGRTTERDQREHRERQCVTSASAVTSWTVSTTHTTIGRT